MTFGTLMSDKFSVVSEDREVLADLKKAEQEMFLSPAHHKIPTATPPPHNDTRGDVDISRSSECIIKGPQIKSI